MTADFHTHSSFSPDGKAGVYDMALAAAEHGVDIMCLTDHADLSDDRTGWPIQEEGFSFREKYFAEIAEASEKLRGRLELLAGLEVGEPNHAPDAARKLAGVPGLDFIIGSLHNLKDMPDFYWIDYRNEKECRTLQMLYVEELMELARLDCYDVVGHIGYARRYMKRAGFDVGLEGSKARLADCFKTLIENGRGIELNTSGLRDGTGVSFPELEYLKLYRSLGGEIVTTGSDAHRPEDAGANIADAKALLREAGFEYFTVFRKRKPEFVKL